MIGILALGVMSGICIHGLFNQATWDGNNRQKSINSNEDYYLDYYGNTRRVDNNHKIAYAIKDSENEDLYDLDLKTGEILNRRPTIEKQQREYWTKKTIEMNEQEKIKAKKEDKYWYYSKEETERTKYWSSPDPKEFVVRRVSDDLLLNLNKAHNIAMDTKVGFILYIRTTNEKKIEYCKEKNREKCTWKSIQKETGMNEKELLEYAKQIGALL